MNSMKFGHIHQWYFMTKDFKSKFFKTKHFNIDGSKGLR